MLQHPNRQSPHDINENDDHRRDGIAPHELAGTIHGPIKIGFLCDLFAAMSSRRLIDQPGVEIGIDAHLFPGHRIKGKPGRHFGNTPGSLGNDDKVDDDQNRKDHDPDRKVAAHHKRAKRLNNLPRRTRPFISVEKDDAGRGNVQRQTKEGQEKQDGGEHGKIDGPLGMHRHEEDQNGDGQAERQTQIQDQGRQG